MCLICTSMYHANMYRGTYVYNQESNVSEFFWVFFSAIPFLIVLCAYVCFDLDAMFWKSYIIGMHAHVFGSKILQILHHLSLGSWTNIIIDMFTPKVGCGTTTLYFLQEIMHNIICLNKIGTLSIHHHENIISVII